VYSLKGISLFGSIVYQDGTWIAFTEKLQAFLSFMNVVLIKELNIAIKTALIFRISPYHQKRVTIDIAPQDAI